SRLDKTQCNELVIGVATAYALAPAVVEDIVAKTDGVPLFIEELTKAVSESATPDRAAVPATLHDSLMARLDRLGPAKEIAQVAAVIGQQFSYELLKMVSPASADQVATGVARLVDAGLAEIGKLAEGQDRSRRELAVLLKLGPALGVMHSPEVEEVYGRAHRVAKELSDETGLFKATWGLWDSATTDSNLVKALDRAQELVTLGQNSTDPDLLLEAFHCRWSTAWFRGDVATALKYSREGIER